MVLNAAECVDQYVYDDSYTTAIVAYAFALRNPTDNRTLSRYQMLETMAKNGQQSMKQSVPLSLELSYHDSVFRLGRT